ncbi:MAG: Uma2 family endonuclease [Caldilineaceae bacterium]
MQIPNAAIRSQTHASSSRSFHRPRRHTISDKFTFYRTIPSLQEYVLIHQDRPHVVHHRKQDSGWLLTDVTSIDASLVLDSCDVEIPLRQIYRQVDWLFAD